MKKEIFARGPIACYIDAGPVVDYKAGIVTAKSDITDHAISVVGWGHDEKLGTYWNVRNSWGEYWGEFGYVRVQEGALNIESSCFWATVKDFTAPERNNQYPCYEGGENCKAKESVVV